MFENKYYGWAPFLAWEDPLLIGSLQKKKIIELLLILSPKVNRQLNAEPGFKSWL